jgi:hypothetical protein
VGRHPLRRALSLAATIGLVLLAAAAPATADGDPASDELIAQNVFYPYSSPVPRYRQRQLDTEVAAAHHAGLLLKIAIIAHPTDLGSITALYGSPQRYAQFLDTEISLNRKIPLLVVMRDGFGSEGLPSALQRAVLAARAPTADTGRALAAATLSLVDRLDTDLGADRATTKGDPALPAHTLVLAGLILAALIVGALLVLARVLFPPTV